MDNAGGPTDEGFQFQGGSGKTKSLMNISQPMLGTARVSLVAILVKIRIGAIAAKSTIVLLVCTKLGARLSCTQYEEEHLKRSPSCWKDVNIVVVIPAILIHAAQQLALAPASPSRSAMDNFTPSSLILVTGANGHVAQHTVAQLLALPVDQRPRTRATVRSETSAAGLKQIFAEHITSGILELVYIPDIAKPSAFDTAVQGCTHIAHIASPLVVGAKDVEKDVLIPAVRGTTSLLNSALTVHSLQSVVVTSSFAAVMDPMYGLRPGHTYTPEDWNPISYETAADPNLDLSAWSEKYRAFITYMASKKLAEKAAWDLYDDAKPIWRFCTINPAYIGGPNVLPLAKGADSLSFSQGLIWQVASSKPGDKWIEPDYPYWVDVRDVARAHIWALVTPASSRERFILGPHRTTYARMADVLRSRMGVECSEEKQELDCFEVESKNCEEILGIKEWVGFEDMVCDTVEQVNGLTK
ncbi:hypothetical protein PMZ80_006946 [Knufia obscura]|uniref:NAD-dependent epimerase/dehydratase domain-containing protein n=1 Tax=Knufia obscura TaxID=1635080 RepID=A0ABR0RIW6_9EURO|nr:hypothetical protein PMZ80_006946 [Knufia obscura]